MFPAPAHITCSEPRRGVGGQPTLRTRGGANNIGGNRKRGEMGKRGNRKRRKRGKGGGANGNGDNGGKGEKKGVLA